MVKKACNKYMILLIVQIIITVVLFMGCYREEQLIYSVQGIDFIGTEKPINNGLQIQGEYMKLTPGVYQVRVQADTMGEQQIDISMMYENTSFNSVRSNIVTIVPGDKYIDFEVYVLDEVSTAYVQCDFTNTDASKLVQLDVYKTNMGNRLLLFIVLLIFFVLDSMLIWRKHILEGKVSKEQQVVFWVLASGVLLAFYPYLTDYIIWGDDLRFHLSRIAFLKDSLLEGATFPVKVQSMWLCEHGYAVSLFYGDLFLYIPAVLMLIGFSSMTAYKMFILLVTVFTAVIAYHCIKKCVKDEYAALFGSMFYLLAPYRLINVYVRSALGELLAMTFLPLICCGVFLLYTEDVTTKEYKKYKWYLILGMSGLLQSHNISVEMTVVFLALICVAAWKRTFCKQTFVQLLQSVGLVLLINAWFWGPFVYMLSSDGYNMGGLENVQMTEAGLVLAEFLQILPTKYSMPTGLPNHVPAQIGGGAIILLVTYILWQWRTRKGSKTCNIFLILALVAIMLCTQILPWNEMARIPIVGFAVLSIQFPWRFMSIASICVAVFAAFFYVCIKEDEGRLVKIATGIAGVIVIVLAVYQVNYITYESEATYMYEEENMGTSQVVNGEYILAGTDTPDYYYHDPIADNGLEWSQYEKSGTNISVRLSNTTDDTLYIEMPLTGYKGYGIEAEGEEMIPYITQERGAHGDLRIAVPAGYQGTIKISYQGNILFDVAGVVSLISLLVICGNYLYKRRKRLHNEE